MNIKDLREKLYLTQPELAKLLNVSTVTISKWERGVVQPSLKHKRKINEVWRNYELQNTSRNYLWFKIWNL